LNKKRAEEYYIFNAGLQVNPSRMNEWALKFMEKHEMLLEPTSKELIVRLSRDCTKTKTKVIGSLERDSIMYTVPFTFGDFVVFMGRNTKAIYNVYIRMNRLPLV
jgi:hypothetical protein